MAEAKKPINIGQVVKYLNHAFSRAQHKASTAIGYKNHYGTKVYDYQVEFAWLINDITKGPMYIAPKKIQAANDLIARLEKESK